METASIDKYRSKTLMETIRHSSHTTDYSDYCQCHSDFAIHVESFNRSWTPRFHLSSAVLHWRIWTTLPNFANRRGTYGACLQRIVAGLQSSYAARLEEMPFLHGECLTVGTYDAPQSAGASFSNYRHNSVITTTTNSKRTEAIFGSTKRILWPCSQL